VSFTYWLENRSGYPEWRKSELRQVYEDMDVWEQRHCEISMFMKDEQYLDFKYPRMINARSDEAKCYFGPWVAAAEKVLFDLPEFIKKIPQSERAEYISSKLSQYKLIYASDFTTYEASFVKEIMRACELQFFEYMLKNISGSVEFLKNFGNALTGWNKCVGKWVTLFIEATRMSGEMNTSSGNGFTTLMLFLFVAFKSGVSMDGLFEGDDALVGATGPLEESLFRELGFVIKLQRFDKLSDASFCGMVFDPADNVVVADPFKILASFGWTTGRYVLSKTTTKMALLRAKALSLAHQYPRCPVVQALARCALRLTKSVDVRTVLNSRNMGWWEYGKLCDALSMGEKKLREMVVLPIPFETRLLVERLYRIDLLTQVAIEEYFDSFTEIGLFDLKSIDHLVPAPWIYYHDRYVVQVPTGTAPSDLAF
jgi:hypothetical protein